MQRMRNATDHKVKIRRGSWLYDAEAGEVVNARPRDVDVLAAVGFEPIDDDVDLESQTKAQLVELASARGVEVTSSMSKADLVSALTSSEEA